MRVIAHYDLLAFRVRRSDPAAHRSAPMHLQRQLRSTGTIETILAAAARVSEAVFRQVASSPSPGSAAGGFAALRAWLGDMRRAVTVGAALPLRPARPHRPGNGDPEEMAIQRREMAIQ